MITFSIIYLTILSFITCPIILPFKTYNPLIMNNNNLIDLIKKTSDEEIVKTLLKNLIYVTLDVGKENISKKKISQKIDCFLNMAQYDFYFNILERINFNKSKKFYPDLQYNNYILLKNILKFTYYNISLYESSFNPSIITEEMNILNETININLKNNTYEKEEKKEIRMFIPYKTSNLYDHRPGVIGLSFGCYFILNLKDKVPIKLDNWLIKYNDYFHEEGELIIGGLTNNYDGQNFKKENLKIAKIHIEQNSHPEWSLLFNKSFIILNNDKEYKLKEYTISSFNIEEFFILGTDEYFHLISKLFFNDYIKKNICQKQVHKKNKYVQNYYHIICYFEGDKQKNR